MNAAAAQQLTRIKRLFFTIYTPPFYFIIGFHKRTGPIEEFAPVPFGQNTHALSGMRGTPNRGFAGVRLR
jgi:hypothetical protein